MTRPTTEELKKTLQELITKHNEALQIQNTCKEQIIAIQAVLQDRELDGNSNTVTSEITED
tara:strand:+ start:1032 stop:1214 length:183 start_codon:yes stop_codon:yes gene_type:complete